MCFGKGQRKTSVLPFLTRVGTRAREWKGNVFVNVTRKRTLWGSGALEFDDLRILEGGGECSGALVSDVVAYDTASERGRMER